MLGLGRRSSLLVLGFSSLHLKWDEYKGLPCDMLGGFLWFYNALNFNKTRRVRWDGISHLTFRVS
jgi:hypothetical protein